MRRAMMAPPRSPAGGFTRSPTQLHVALYGTYGFSGTVIKQLPWGLLQKTQTRKMPSFPVVARTPFWSFCAGQRRIGPGQITDGT